jgi:ABC-type uncharacterized transport system YnjBCD substrate-binding protein
MRQGSAEYQKVIDALFETEGHNGAFEKAELSSMQVVSRPKAKAKRLTRRAHAFIQYAQSKPEIRRVCNHCAEAFSGEVFVKALRYNITHYAIFVIRTCIQHFH